MSAQGRVKRKGVPDIAERKGGPPIVCLTAYTAPIAGLLDPHVDLLLVGDSLGMVIYGLDDTLGVSLDMMIAHGAAVVRGSKRACVVIDLPFGSYQASPAQAFEASARVLAETGAAAVKLEGGREMAETVAFLVERGVPVMGHVGLTPQKLHALGGFRVVGRRDSGRQRVLDDANAIAEAGAFSLVVEGVPESLGREVTDAVAIPTIGIGASAACDGQILVGEDMLGLFTEFKPKFVRRFATIAEQIEAAAAAYKQAVTERSFPGEAEIYPDTPAETKGAAE